MTPDSLRDGSMGEVVKLSLCKKSLMTLCHCRPACGVLYRVFTSTTMSLSLPSVCSSVWEVL